MAHSLMFLLLQVPLPIPAHHVSLQPHNIFPIEWHHCPNQDNLSVTAQTQLPDAP